MADTLTLLEIIQAVTAELGLNQTTSVAGSTDLQINQLQALANRTCQEIYRTHEWTNLQFEHIINVETPTVTTGDVVQNSDIITNIPSTADLSTAYAVSGTGQPQAQHVAEILSATSVRTSMEATASEVGASLTFAKFIYDIPEDFDRFIGQTWWDRTNHWRLIGPDSPQMRQYLLSGIFATGPRVRWSQMGRRPGAWVMWPPPTSLTTPDALVYEYISRNWCLKEDDTTANTMTADTDRPLLDPQGVILDIKWRWRQIKGLEYASYQQEAIDYITALAAVDGGIPDLYLNRQAGPYYISSDNVQDSGWPGPGN